MFQESAQKSGIDIKVQRAPNDGYFTEVWNKRPFSASYWAGRPVQDQMYSTAYFSTAAWNDTHFNSPKFNSLVLQGRGELDDTKRRAIYKEASTLLSDTGGVILPMFNDYISAYSDKVAGWEANPNQDMMNGLAGVLTWQA